jgi:hypothetical protein
VRSFLLCILLAIPTYGQAMSIEEHILVHYRFVIDRLNTQGYKGPFAGEIAKFTLIRQIVEDGPTRNHSTSIVGMSVGGANAEALRDVGLTMGCVNADGLSLKTCASEEGQNTYYAIYGPRANACSAAALAVLWDKYINEKYRDKFTSEEIEGWNRCKSISDRIACDGSTQNEEQQYLEVLGLGKIALRKANTIYSSTAAHVISKTVEDMEPLFEFAKSK